MTLDNIPPYENFMPRENEQQAAQAFGEVLVALRDLTDDQRTRALCAAAVFFGIERWVATTFVPSLKR